MPNFSISDLPTATLPLDIATTFFELQTFEGGVQVSRKLSAQNLGIGGSVTSITGGVNINIDNTDPMIPIVNLDAAITGVSVNGVTLSNAGAATNFLDETGNYSVPGADHVDGPASSVANQLVIWDGVTGKLIKDSTDITASASTLDSASSIVLSTSGTTKFATQTTGIGVFGSTIDLTDLAAPTFMQLRLRNSLHSAWYRLTSAGDLGIWQGDAAGTRTDQWINMEKDGSVTLYRNDAPRLITAAAGIDLRGNTGNNPQTGAAQDTNISFGNSGGSSNAYLGFNLLSFNTDFLVANRVLDGKIILAADANAFQAPVVLAETTTAALGGLLVNNLATGAGLERVLTTADAGGAVPDPLIIGSINATSALTPTTGAGYINCPINIGANLSGTMPMTVLARQRIQNQTSSFAFGGTLFIQIDGGDTIIGGLNGANVTVDYNNSVELQHGTSANVICRTVANGLELPLDGTLYIDERASAAGDVAGQGQFWVRNDAPNTPMFTTDTGVDIDLSTGAASSLQATMAIGATTTIDLQIITGAALTIFDAADSDSVSVEINSTTMAPAEALVFDASANVEVYSFDKSINIDAGDLNISGSTSGVEFYRYGDAVSSSLKNSAAGITLQVVGTGNLFRIQAPSIELQETSAPEANSGGYGQIWIRDDTDQQLFFTDDDGEDWPIAYAEGRVTVNSSFNFNTAGNRAPNWVGYYADGSNNTITTEASTSVVNWPVGTAVQVIAPGSGTQTVAEGAGTTIFDDSGTDLVGGFTLSQGVITIFRASTTDYITWGSGITP